MLGFFSAKSDHPLADAKELRAVLEALVHQEPAAALDETTAWLESLTAAEDLKLDQRLDIMLRLDDATLPHARRLGRDYLTAEDMSRSQEVLFWRRNHDYWAQLAAAYESCAQRRAAGEKDAKSIDAVLPLLLARLTHAYAVCIKWVRFHYGTIDGSLWQGAGRAYLAAHAAGVAQKRLSLYGQGQEAAVEQEYLKTLALHASAVDNLLPLEMEIAERLIAYLLPQLVFVEQPRPDCVYWLDAAEAAPPRRLIKLPEGGIAATMRFIAPGKAIEVLADIRARIEENHTVPAELNLGGQYPTDVVLGVLDHLTLNWMPTPPTRSHVRRLVKARLAVINGLPTIHAWLSGMRGASEDNAETWLAEDVSIGGMGARTPPGGKDWLRIGVLVGVQPEGGDNWLIGVVRRFKRGSEGAHGAVGIQTIGKTPRAVTADSGGLKTDLLLLDAPPAGTAPDTDAILDIVLPASAYEVTIPLNLELDGRLLRLYAQALLERGVGYAIGRYRVERVAA